MAGLFGLFNYEKEGPGIDKNAPKKKAFFVFFETFFRNFWKFIPISLVFDCISLPVLTGGLASVGMTKVARDTARDKHSFGLPDFFECIKKNWKQALPMGIINAIITVVLGFDVYFFWMLNGTQQSFWNTLGLGFAFALCFVFACMKFYMWTLCITFGLNLSTVYRNSFKFVFLNLWKNLLCGVCLLAVYAVDVLLAWLILQTNLVVLLVLLVAAVLCTLPGFRFLLIQYCTFPAIKKFMIDPYYAEHPDADLELRRDLGLEVEEDDEEDEEEEAFELPEWQPPTGE